MRKRFVGVIGGFVVMDMGHAAAAVGALAAGAICSFLTAPVYAAVDVPAVEAPAVDVIPLPSHVELRAGDFTIRAGTRVVAPRDPRAMRVARYFADLMQKTHGLALQVGPAQAATGRGAPALANAAVDRPAHGGSLARTSAAVDVPARARAYAAAASPDPSAIVFELRPNPSAPPNPESYTLNVGPDRIVLSAAGPRGLFYAAVTLWQLTTQSSVVSTSSATTPSSATSRTSVSDKVNVPAVHIIDSPRFAWRGLMLDSARHYQSPEFILKFIDWMALHKLNVLHWHLTDDQAWRLEIKKYPRLTSVGAWRVPAGAAPAADIDSATGRPRLHGGFYSQETVRKIVAHAAERNITIVPEIDMPGHATAAVVAYPRLASVVPAPAVVPSDWGVYSNLYNPDESTFEFLENVLAEVVQLFPSQFVHIGGDEAVKDQWKASPRIQERMHHLGVSNEEALQRYFVERIGKFLTGHHRRLIGWDEILEGGIPDDATIMSWRGVEGAYSAASAGHDAVLSPSPTLYFDHIQSVTNTQPGRGGVISLEDVYRFDPMPSTLAPDLRPHILGVQANIWTEHMRTEKRIEYMAFPRAAAVAEVGWSPEGSLNWNRFLARLPAQMRRYSMVGIEPFVLAQDPQAPVSRAHDLVSKPPAGLSSHELESCTNKVVLSLEDDAPIQGPRAAFSVDIMNPCWIYAAADLSKVSSMVAYVGQVPFNFQLGADIRGIKLNRPQTPSGELEVRIDGCDGERIAALSLQPAIANNGVTELPAANLGRREGTHDLCFKFTQRSLDPLWVIDRIRLE